jgi:hypothetical protein
VKSGRVLFDVYFKWDKCFIDEARNFVVGKGFGLQPDTSASARCSTEVDQERQATFLCFFESCLGILSPLYSHVYYLPFIRGLL